MKNVKKHSIILFLITIVILAFILKDDYETIIKNLMSAKIPFVLLAMVFAVLYWFFKSLALFNIVKEYRKEVKRKEIFKQITISQFFNGITPFASGGQPMQIYMLKKSGIKLTHSTNIIIQDFILYQMALITHGVIAVLLNLKYHWIASNNVLLWLTICGFVVNSLVGVGLILVSFSKGFNNFVVNKIIGFLSKIKIVKHYDKTIENWKSKLKEFDESAALLRRKKELVIKGFVYHFMGLLCYYLTPLFVIYSLGLESSINPFIVYVCCAYVSIIGAFIPIPGGSGGIEGSFLVFFGKFIKTTSSLNATLIIWRSVTYYFAIILGGIMFNTFKGVDEKCE